MKKLLLATFCIFGLQAIYAQKYTLVQDAKSGLYGYRDDRTGKWAMAPKYASAGTFAKNGLAFVCRDRWHCGCVDTNFKVKIPLIYFCDDYMSAPSFSDSGTLLIAKGHKMYDEWEPLYGMIDEKGKTILPAEYDLIHEVTTANGGYYVLRDSAERYGAVDMSGSITIPFTYGPLAIVDDNVLQAVKYPLDTDRTRGLIDLQNNIILPLEYQSISYYNTKNVIIAQKDNKYGMLRIGTLQELIPFSYDEIRFTLQSTSTVWVKKGKLFGFADADGSMLTDVMYENPVMSVMEEKGNRLMATLNGKYGLLTITAKPAVPFEYEFLWTVDGRIYTAKKNGKYGYIDSSGNTIADFVYDSVGYFYGYFGIVKRNGLYGAVDADGKLILPVAYENLETRYLNDCGSLWSWHKYIIYRENNLYGLIDRNGKKVLPAAYQEIYLDGNEGGLIIAKQNNKYGFADTLGNSIIPFSYNSIATDACKFFHFPGGFLLSADDGNYIIDWKKRIAVKTEKTTWF